MQGSADESPPPSTQRGTVTGMSDSNVKDRSDTDPAVAMIRHSLATLAYRAAKAVRNAPSHFGTFRVGDTTRTPGEILAHMGDLMDWALTIAQRRTQWRVTQAHAWCDDVSRLFAG